MSELIPTGPEPNFPAAVDAMVRHLESLQSQGHRTVPVTAATWTALKQSPQPAAKIRPIPLSAPEPAPGLRPASTGASSAAGSSTVVAPAPAKPSTPARASAPVAMPGLTVFSSAPLPPPLEGQARVLAVNELRTQALGCARCPHLAASRRQVVFGVGDVFSPLLFVGEAPGADEDLQGEPFVGKAGQLLTKIIETMGLSRDRVYIANILKCRPDTPGQTSGNRKPRPDEMQTCFPYLQAQIDLIQPKVMVALGATAVEGLLGIATGITKLRGQWQTFRGIPVMPTYHPAYLLRNMALSERRRVWEDMLQVMERLGMPISEKQRTYFQKPAEG